MKFPFKNIKAILFIAYALFFLSATCRSFAADTVQYFDNGRINWSEGKIYAWGSASVDESIQPGRLAEELAKKKSLIIAKENLTDIIKKVKLDSKISVEDLNESIRYAGAKINNVVKIAGKNTSLATSESAKTTLVMEIYGKLSSSLLPLVKEETPVADPDKLLIERLRNKNLAQNMSDVKATPAVIVEGKYSGLIVDARHLDIVPVLFPIIVNEKGTEIYGISKFTTSDIKKGNIVIYTKDLKSALSHSRTGQHPIVIRAVKSSNNSNGIIISNADARKIKFENKKNNFLEEGKVAIVLD